VRALIGKGLVAACHDLSDGGLALGLAEMTMPYGIGATIADPAEGVSLTGCLFGEDQGRYLLACQTPDLEDVEANLRAAGVPFAVIGRTEGNMLALPGAAPISVRAMARAHEAWLPDYVAKAEA